MHYTSYWSILDSPSYTIKPNFVCLTLAIGFGVCWMLIKKFKKDNNGGDKLTGLWATGTFAFFGLILFFILTYTHKDNSDAEISKLLNSQSFKKIEGLVSDFKRTYRYTKLGSETIETFTVDSVKFAYGDALLGEV